MTSTTPLRKDSYASSTGTNDSDPYQSQEYLDALEDVHTRFILNLPDSELQTADRIFFQLEQAWWFYQDFIVDLNPDKNLPSFTTFKPFASRLFQYSPLLPDASNFPQMWSEFSQYRRKISNYGCILLSQDFKSIVLCQVWNGKTLTFPAGKINQGEDGATAAARETYEETGFDPHCGFGLTASWKERDPSKITWKPLRQNNALVFQEESGKRRTCYVCHGVPTDFPFAPVVRKEVSEVAWYSLDENIPKPSYGVLPFLPQLRRWIKRNKFSHKDNKKSRERAGRKTPKRDSRGRDSRGRDSRGRVREKDVLIDSGLASAGDVSGWSEEDMFETNERLLGRKIEYDGNPHAFEEGFGGNDPHAFHVVQGGFLNAGITKLAPPPESSKLQPLFRKETSEEGSELKPFFSNDGATPWGEVVEEAKEGSPRRASRQDSGPQQTQEASEALLAMLKSGGSKEQEGDEDIITDAQITAKSQSIKGNSKREARRIQYEEDMEYIRQWVANLPKPKPTKHFGEFKLDADAIMAQAMKR